MKPNTVTHEYRSSHGSLRYGFYPRVTDVISRTRE